MKFTDIYNKYVFNIRLVSYSFHLEVVILQPWKQLPEHFNFLKHIFIGNIKKKMFGEALTKTFVVL